MYGGLIVGAGIGEISARTFYALGRNWIPTLIGIIGFTLGTIAKFLVVDRYQAAGLVGATSAYYLLNAVIFLVWLRAVGLGIGWGGLAGTLLRSGIAAALAVGLAYVVMTPDSPVRVLAGIAVACGTYVITLAISGDEFARRAVKLLGIGSPSRNGEGG